MPRRKRPYGCLERTPNSPFLRTLSGQFLRPMVSSGMEKQGTRMWKCRHRFGGHADCLDSSRSKRGNRIGRSMRSLVRGRTVLWGEFDVLWSFYDRHASSHILAYNTAQSAMPRPCGVTHHVVRISKIKSLHTWSLSHYRKTFSP